MKYILAVDIGTTSSKALVVSQAGDVMTSVQEFYPTRHAQPDYAEQDPEEIFRAVKKVIRHAAGAVHGRIDALSFSSAMHGLMAVDRSGLALTPLIIWADLRSKDEVAEINSLVGHAIYVETGTPIHPMTPFCKLLWMKKNQNELLRSAYKFIGIKEYIWFKFFQEFAVDHSIASATGLFHTENKSWSTLALEAIGISAEQLSRPCSVYSVFQNPVEHEINEMGIAPDVKWVIGASDGCLAHLGSGALDENTLSLTVGTSGAVRKVVKNIYPDALGRTFHYLLDEQVLITGGATNNGAILVQWFAENILKEKVDVKSFGERASQVPPGSEGLIFLPYVLGERAPVFDSDSAGVFFGVRQLHTQAHFMRALLEGVGYALLSIAEIVEQNSGAFENVIASGGFIKSPHWVQMVADIFGRELTVRGSEDASALGAVMAGFKALGIPADLKFANERIFHPELAHFGKYREYFKVYKNLYPHLSEDFHLLNQVAKP